MTAPTAAPRVSRRALYRAVDGVVVRAPLLPVQRFLGLGRPGRPEHEDPLVEQALCVASEDLWAAVRRPGPAGTRQAQALLRYLIRGATRPTPYGLFAAAAVGEWGDSTTLRIGAGPRPTRSRPDMGWLTDEVLRLEREAPDQLCWVAHRCAFEHTGRVYLSDPEPGAGEDDVSVRATPLVRRVLAAARRPTPYDTLVATVLEAAPGATRARAVTLVDRLRGAGLLHSDLRPPLTGEPARQVRRRLDGVPCGAETARRLDDAARLADVLDAGPADPVDALTALRSRLRSATPSAVGEVVQVDSALPLAGRAVSAEVALDAARAVDLLVRMHPAPGGPRHLAAYRAAFLERYGADRRVPLLPLLDPRFGLGAPDRRHVHHGSGRDERRSAHLMELASLALLEGRDEIELGPADVDALSTGPPDPQRLIPSLELSAFLLASSPAAVDRGDYRLVVGPNLGAHAAGRGLGRFADLLGAPATDLLAQLAEAEDAGRAGGIVAELTYLPRHHRSANVAVCPTLRRYEIPIGVTPGVAPERVVAPDELSVFVRDGRLRLWWDREGVEVVVAAGHMLTTHGAPDVCRFLHEVGLDGRTPLAGFDWGAAAGLPVLPRVRHGRIVLHPARWHHTRRRAADALRVCEGPAAFAAALDGWRRRWRIPQRVYLTAGDNRLLLDLDDPAQAELLRADLRRPSGGDLVLQEALPGPDDAWLPGPGGRYVCELVVPLVRRAPDAAPVTVSAPVACAGEPDRRRPPGSDWLYLTLTGPAHAQDGIIAGPLREVAETLVARGHARSWFFLRYADPVPQLRLRLHGRPDDLLEHALPAVLWTAAELVSAGSLSRVGLEVYEREVERYGGPRALEVVESLFAVDSRAVARLLPLVGEAGERLAVTALAVDDLLRGLGLDDVARLAWYSEHAPPPRESAPAHREFGGRIAELCAGTRPGDAVTREVIALRNAEVARLGGELARLHRDGACDQPVASLARSLVHMLCNRLGIDRPTERIVLGLLRRHAHSRSRADRTSREAKAQVPQDHLALVGGERRA